MKIPQNVSLFRRRAPQFSTGGLVAILALVIVNVLVLTKGDEFAEQLAGTPLPTRTSNSFMLEGQAFFMAGNLTEAINAYEDALEIDPNNAVILTELARIKVYSAKLLTGVQVLERLEEAQEIIERAVESAPDDSNVHAVKALTYDWLATDINVSPEKREEYLLEASRAATTALQLGPGNPLAIAYRAEVLMDQGNFTQAGQQAKLAVDIDPNLMDTHRVYAYVMESTGNYAKAIEEYKAAAEIMPNLTFLYISIGQNYRQLELYDQALEYFDRAATINLNLGIEDPLPYLAIAKTYTRQGQFFAAAINGEKALSLDAYNPDLYGQLGYIYFQARNYEGAIPMLACAVEGCVVWKDEVLGVLPTQDASEQQQQTLEQIVVAGEELGDSTVVYYYVYSSVLAAYNRCDEAEIYFDQIEARYSGDSIIMGIIEENRNICEIFGQDDGGN